MPATAGKSEMLETLIVDGTSTAAGAAKTAESLTSRNSRDVDNSSGLTAAQETTATSGDSRTDERSQ